MTTIVTLGEVRKQIGNNQFSLLPPNRQKRVVADILIARKTNESSRIAYLIELNNPNYQSFQVK